MNRSSAARKLPINTTEELNAVILDSILDIKGKQVVMLDMRALHDAPTDFFIICQGESSTQIRSIAERIRLRVKNEMGVHASHYEGAQNAKWICIDYFNTVVHVFYPETREFYGLEDLWSDADFTRIDED